MLAVAEPPEEADIPVEVVETETFAPDPLNATVCGESGALSVIVIAPVNVPPAVGVKVTEIVQFAAAATFAPQLFVSAKFVEAEIDVMLSAALPELVSVTLCAALVEPTASEEKFRLVGESVAPGAGGGPVVSLLV